MPRKPQNNLFDLPGRDLKHIVDHALRDLEPLRGKKLFLTGGTGFFGKWLLAGLCHANAELDLALQITVLSRNPARFQQQFSQLSNESCLNFVTGDVALFSTDNRVFDFVIHGAADTTAVATDTEERTRERVIVGGTGRILSLAGNCGARVLNLSSGAVYGGLVGQPAGAKEEDFESAVALIPYGRAKREAEQLCVDSGVDFVTARGFAFLGPYLPLDAHFAAGNFLRDALAGGPIRVRGDGSALRSYLHPADLIVWLLGILVRGRHGQAYNVGSDEVVSTAQLARRIAGAIEPKPEVVIQSVQAEGPQNIYLPNITRARTELGLDVRIELSGAIARTLEFFEEAKPKN
jgi:nucleoside-diphosphate-sugar epimerase